MKVCKTSQSETVTAETAVTAGVGGVPQFFISVALHKINPPPPNAF